MALGSSNNEKEHSQILVNFLTDVHNVFIIVIIVELLPFLCMYMYM